MKKPPFIIALLISASTFAQKQRPEVSLLFGLNQPLVLQGFNFEVNYWTKKLVIDYSHGFDLKLQDDLVSPDSRNQHLAFNITHTLGLGFGYRFTEGFNLRIEPKIHIWEMYYDDAFRSNEGKIKTYSTYTLGLGAYYRWMPFKKSETVMRGLTIAPSARWWPNIASTLDNNKYEYYNTRTLKTEVHRANNIGISNTPWFVNVSVGWTL